jgi:hypothetical protein
MAMGAINAIDERGTNDGGVELLAPLDGLTAGDQPGPRGAAAPATETEVQGLAAADAGGGPAEVIESVEGSTHAFEPLDVLARRYGRTPAAVLSAFEGRVLFVKWIAGKPLLRTVDVERMFG